LPLRLGSHLLVIELDIELGKALRIVTSMVLLAELVCIH